MGCCFSGESEEATQQPDPVERRRLQAEAAERRLQEQANRGITNPESVRRRQEKAAEVERLRQSMGNEGGGLQWRVSG